MARQVVCAVALLLVLAGCGGDPKADPSPSPSTPVTSPAGTTPAPPVMPDEAKADTKAGAIAFVEYYVELINHAQSTGDVQGLQAVESPACKSCLRVRTALTEIYTGGGHITGGDWLATIRSAARRPDVPGWSVFADVRYGPQTVKRASGTTSLQGGQSPMTFVIGNSGGNWTVVGWSRAS